MEGVVGVITAKDIIAPGYNDISANHLDDEPVFPTDESSFSANLSLPSLPERGLKRARPRLKSKSPVSLACAD